LSDVDRLEAFEGIGKALFGDVKWAKKKCYWYFDDSEIPAN